MKEGFLRSDTPQSEKLRVEVTSCLFLLLLDLFQTFLAFIQFMPRLGVQGEKEERNKLPFESCAFFSSTLSFLALVLAFLTLLFVFAVMVFFFRLFPPFAVFIIPLLSSHFEPSHFLILFSLPLSYSFSLLNFLIPVFHYLS